MPNETLATLMPESNILESFAGHSIPAVPVLSGMAILLVAVTIYFRSRNQKPLPPGPPRWPILGNVFDRPRGKEWYAYTEWGRLYGDVVALSIFGETVIILNSVKAANELLYKRSSIYSDRPHLPMRGDLIGWDHALVGTHYGDYFRQMRGLSHQIFGPRPAREFWPVVERETAHLLNKLLQSPEDFLEHIRNTAGATILKITHGYAISETKPDPFLAHAEKALEGFYVATNPGRFLVDFVPLLKYVPSWFPGAGFRRKAIEWRKALFAMADTAHDFAKKQIGSTGHRRAVIHFEAVGGLIHPREGIFSQMDRIVALRSFQGADTNVSVISAFYLAMCMYPEVQAKAQAELDAVVGNDRLPNTEDRPSLPYLNALMREVVRWGPVESITPHRLTQDDEYRGYKIPAGSLVISNIWGMAHNTELFPDPTVFRPERFMGSDKIDDPAADPWQFVFGFGRRICPGQHLAEPTLFVAAALTLATFNISKAQDEKGNTIEPPVHWLTGLVKQPGHFHCKITPRSDRAIELIKQAVGEEKA